MLTKVSIDLNRSWVLEHRNDVPLPVDSLKAKIEKLENVKIERTTYSAIIFTLPLSESEAEAITDKIIDDFGDHYKIDPHILYDIVYVIFDEEDDSEREDDGDSSTDGKVFDRLFGSPLLDDDDEEDDEASESDEAAQRVAEVLQKIDAMAGGADFKKWARALCGVAPYIKENNTFDTFMNQTYLFSINSGNGLSTYLSLMAELIVALGICPNFKKPSAVMERRIPSPKNGNDDPFDDELSSTFALGKIDNVSLLCIDLSEWIDNLNHVSFKNFLVELPRQIGKFIIVFRVPFVDKDILNRLHGFINDVVSVKGIAFPPHSKMEIQRFAKAEIERYGFRISNAAWEAFHERINEERSDGRFYGFNTVRKVVRELLYVKQLQSAKRGKNDLLISKKDALAICENIDGIGLSGYEMLDRLVCADALKEKINEIIAQILLARASEKVEIPSIHMRFVGNPGTGKTTVARIIGKILREKGVLRVGGFFEYGGRDFCGRYIGETAPKTVSMCRDAYGSVLFIDEAYSLYRGAQDTKDFGREALDVLIAEMENHRSDLVVIMAGYPDEMKILMQGNAGLASRMPYVIEFPNFDRKQLYEIYVSMVNRQFTGDEALFAAAKRFFDGIPDSVLNSKEFSNARFVRNLFERTWAKASMRCQLEESSDISIKKIDFEAATADKEFNFNANKKTCKIGF